MRLFVAIELTDAAREAIALEQKRIAAAVRKAGRTAARPVHPEHMHLTLAFIGEVPAARVPAIVEAMSPPIARPPFDIAFGGVGAFPPHGAPRVLWLGVLEGASAAIAVQRLVVERLQAVGVEPERREFHPHLTLGRWKESRPSDRPRDDHRPAARVATVHVEAVTLVESRLSSDGPTYTALARAPLAGGPALH